MKISIYSPYVGCNFAHWKSFHASFRLVIIPHIEFEWTRIATGQYPINNLNFGFDWLLWCAGVTIIFRRKRI